MADLIVRCSCGHAGDAHDEDRTQPLKTSDGVIVEGAFYLGMCKVDGCDCFQWMPVMESDAPDGPDPADFWKA